MLMGAFQPVAEELHRTLLMAGTERLAGPISLVLNPDVEYESRCPVKMCLVMPKESTSKDDERT